MTCADVHTQILEAERTPIQVRAHALHCPDCATLVSAVEAETSDFADAVHAFEMAVPFDHAWDMASARLNQRPAPPRAFDRRFHITAALIAAVAVLAGGGEGRGGGGRALHTQDVVVVVMNRRRARAGDEVARAC